MNNERFEGLVDTLFDECIATLFKKGMEYSGLEDRLANFKRQSITMDIPKERILQVYLQKHLDSIDTYLKTYLASGVEEADKNLSEPIMGRFVDVINYYLLLYAMIEEAHHIPDSCLNNIPPQVMG